MRCTVRDVVTNPTLATRALAGVDGLARELTWAHSIEIMRPWEWMGSGELLMTTGQNFPEDPDGQVEFIRNLDASGISGIALAERMAAGLTPEAVAVADELGFPVLETAYEIPFVLIARAVAATHGRDLQVTAIQRVYELFRQSTLEGVTGEVALQRLGGEVGARLRVLSVDGWEVALADDPAFAGYSAELIERFPTRAPLSAVTRVVDDSGTRILLLPVGDAPRYVLAAEIEGQAVDLVLLQQVATIAGVHAEMRAAENAARLHASTRLFTQLLSGDFDADSAHEVLGDFDVGGGPWAVAAIEAPGEEDPMRLHDRLRRAGVPALICRLKQFTMVLFLEAHRSRLRATLEHSSVRIERAGVSQAIPRLSAVADGVREAAWASQAAGGDGPKVAEYGEDRPLFMPATVTEARTVVERVLGAVDAYDREHRTELVRSLDVYFDENRSGVDASERLGIHRQTLIYRLKRVEQITGRRLDSLDDLTELHLAMRIRRRLVGESDGGHGGADSVSRRNSSDPASTARRTRGSVGGRDPQPPPSP